MSGNCKSCSDSLFYPQPAGETNGLGGLHGNCIDDIELPCGHHFHRSCFKDQWLSSRPDPMISCPHCHGIIIDPNSGQLLVIMRNEYGEHRGFDIGRLFSEEESLNPELLRMRAWLTFCVRGEGETVLGMVDSFPDLLACREFETGQTCLHIAVRHGHIGLAMVLLSKGADKYARDLQGRTYVDLARELGVTGEDMARLING